MAQGEGVLNNLKCPAGRKERKEERNVQGEEDKDKGMTGKRNERRRRERAEGREEQRGGKEKRKLHDMQRKKKGSHVKYKNVLKHWFSAFLVL